MDYCRQTYESIQGSSGESKYEKLSTVSKREGTYTFTYVAYSYNLPYNYHSE